jgi:hypothetical protein
MELDFCKKKYRGFGIVLSGGEFRPPDPVTKIGFLKNAF